MAESEEEKTPLQQKLDEFGEQLSKVRVIIKKKNIHLFFFFLWRLFLSFAWLFGLLTLVISMILFMVVHGFVVLSIISRLLLPLVSSFHSFFLKSIGNIFQLWLLFLRVYQLLLQLVLHWEHVEWQKRMQLFVHYHQLKHLVVHQLFVRIKQEH